MTKDYVLENLIGIHAVRTSDYFDCFNIPLASKEVREEAREDMILAAENIHKWVQENYQRKL